MDRTVVIVALAFSITGAVTAATIQRSHERTNERAQAVIHACFTSTGPSANNGTRRRAAAARVIELTNQWDDHSFNLLRGAHGYGPELFKAQASFIHEKLGDCGEPIEFKRGKKRTRFYAECERGVMEVAPAVDEKGKARNTLFGAQDVEPGPGVREAAESVLRLRQDWDADFATHLLAPKVDQDNYRQRLEKSFDELGQCEIAAVDLAGVRGAIFQLSCEQGQRSMKVSLDGESRIRVTKFWPIRERRPGQ